MLYFNIASFILPGTLLYEHTIVLPEMVLAVQELRQAGEWEPNTTLIELEVDRDQNTMNRVHTSCLQLNLSLCLTLSIPYRMVCTQYPMLSL